MKEETNAEWIANFVVWTSSFWLKSSVFLDRSSVFNIDARDMGSISLSLSLREEDEVEAAFIRNY